MEEMTPQEHVDTEEWFFQTDLALSEIQKQIDDALDVASVQEKNDWLLARGRIGGTLSMVRAAEEAFFARQTLMLRPPSQAVIDETVSRCEALAELIAEARKAKAVVKLAGDLSRFVSRVLT